MKYNPDIHHRRSIRYRGYDYRQPGAYFVTLCTYHKAPLFGKIVEDIMQLSPFGDIAHVKWQDMPTHHTGLQCPVWVVMPNHLHGILVIENDHYAEEAEDEALARKTADANAPSLRNAPAGSLGAIVGNYKSITTREVNQLRGTPGDRVWQSNYYERIIRDDIEYNRIASYIQTNPARWEKDDYHV